MVVCTANCIEWIKIGISGLTLVSIFLAFLTYRANLGKINDDRARERDKEYVAQFKTSLEWSFNALTSDETSLPPKADRLNWLTAARHILRANKIKGLITHPTYVTIAEEIEEFWRHKYYLALADPSLRSWHYFYDKDMPTWPENIEVTSALVVIDFSNWKDGTPDPTDSVDNEALMTSGAGLKGNAGMGLRAYIENFEALKKSRQA